MEEGFNVGQTKRPSLETAFSKRLHLRLPLVVAPMAGVTTPEMVAHASNAGAVGSLACAYLSAEQIEDEIQKTTLLTTRPFAVNLFCPPKSEVVSDVQKKAALDVTQVYRAELGLAQPDLENPALPDFSSQFEVVLRMSPSIFSFTFGVFDRDIIDACRNRGIATLGTATTLDEAQQLEAVGVTYMCLQGTEAGGHRGLFSQEADEPGVSTEDLLREVSAKVKTPLIVAGGIMHGREIAHFIGLGAQAVQMGTAFLLTHEAKTSKTYRELLLEKKDSSEKPELTRSFTGRLARGFETRFQKEMKASPHAILPFPLQHALTKPLRAESERRNQPDLISAWAGMGVDGLRNGFSTVGLIHELEREGLAALASQTRVSI